MRYRKALLFKQPYKQWPKKRNGQWVMALAIAMAYPYMHKGFLPWTQYDRDMIPKKATGHGSLNPWQFKCRC